jgi:hypothetical protein
MTINTSQAVREGRLNAISTGWGATPKLRLYTGTMPALTTTALSGNTMLAEVTPAPAAASTTTNVTTKDMLGGAKSTTGVNGPGTASFYRVYDSAGTTCHEQGSVGTSGTDLIIDNTSINTGQTVNFNTWVKTEPGT